MTDLAVMLEEEEEATGRELNEALDSSDDSGLKVLDVAILGFLAVKVVLPIATGFVGRELWERYNRIRTRRQAEEARRDLAGAKLTAAVVEEDDVIAGVVESLREEGVSPEDAERFARRAYERMRKRAA
jgi:hypothetical protein